MKVRDQLDGTDVTKYNSRNQLGISKSSPAQMQMARRGSYCIIIIIYKYIVIFEYFYDDSLYYSR